MSWLYHEKQDAALCGVHALNNLLQGPYYTEVELMQIAHRLDADERTLMSEQGVETIDFIKFAAEDSANVSEDGNFSIEVLKKALSVFGLLCTPITHPDMKSIAANPMEADAFLCNLRSHWFGIRKIEKKYWDLNSLLKQPNYLGELYLGIYLKQLQQEGYSIFVVTGEFPQITRNNTDPHWVHITNKTNKSEHDLAAALEASLLSIQTNNVHLYHTDADLERAIQVSLAVPSVNNNNNRNVYRNDVSSSSSPPSSFVEIDLTAGGGLSEVDSTAVLEDDADLEAALQLSLQSGAPEYDDC